MRKQNCYCPENQWCCHCKGYQTDFAPVVRSPSYKETFIAQNECLKCNCANYPVEPRTTINESVDKHAKNGSSAFRQMNSEFIKSDSGCSLETENSLQEGVYPAPQSYHESRVYDQNRSLVQRPEVSPEYSPKSGFLKKLKHPCHCADNKQQKQNYLSNSNNCTDFIPKVCEECITKSNQIIELLEQLNNHTFNVAHHYNEQNRRFQSSPERSRADPNTLNRAEEITRSFANQLKHVLTSARPHDQSFGNEEYANIVSQDFDNNQYLGEPNDALSYNRKLGEKKKKGQHVSRSKKRVKCRGRRKRKSNDSEKCYSQDYFEPSLKKPHENSCERCWRYASPSRSPVNKPDQRYDPNFRKAHSFHDLTTNGSDRDYPNAEINEKPSSPRNAQFAEPNRMNELTNMSPQSRSPGRGYSNVKEKDKTFENPPTRPNWNEIQKDRTIEKNDRTINLNLSDRERSMRLNGFSPGKGQSGVSDDLNSTQYKQVRYRSSSPPNSTKQSEWRNGERSNSSYLRKENRNDSQFTDASFRSRMNTNVEGRFQSPQYKMNQCRECHCVTSNKNHETPLTFASPTLTKSAPKTNSSRPSRSGTAIGSPRIHPGNKYQAKRAESPKHDPSSARNSRNEEYLLSNKTQTPDLNKSRRRSPVNKRPQTANFDKQTSVEHRNRNLSPRSRKESDINESSDMKCCYCYKNSPKLQPEVFTNPYESPKKLKYCRHHPRRMSYDVSASTFMPSPAFSSTPLSIPPQCVPVVHNCPESGYLYENNYNLPRKYQSASFNAAPCYPGQNISLPRRCYTVNTAFCDPSNCPLTKDKTYGLKNNNSKDLLTNFSQNLPKKYCVFYMSKNLYDRENDVQVLVEEVAGGTENGKKDSKLETVEEKMKKLQECPLESMALKFQKGVNELYKNPESSRVLYF